MIKKGYKQTAEHKANSGEAVKKFHETHPDANKEWHSTPKAKANQSAANLQSDNTPAVIELIQQYGSPLINKLRRKYYALNYRCNNPMNSEYKNYGGRGIQNLFTSQFHFLNYVINELHITQLSQIQGLEIDRINNDGNYEPGNIRFVTRKVNANNIRKK